MFSFNSPLGACESCRGFGRVIGVDFGLVVPNETLSLKGGAVRPWQTASFKECQDDLEKYAKKRKIPLDKPWNELSPEQKHWVLEGEPEWVSWRKSWPGVWYGVRRFFKWLESKAYKMHIRVLLSKYRAYTECLACLGTRLKPEGAAVEDRGQVDPRPDAPADLANKRILRESQKRLTRPPTSCSRRSAPACATCATSASAT